MVARKAWVVLGLLLSSSSMAHWNLAKQPVDGKDLKLKLCYAIGDYLDYDRDISPSECFSNSNSFKIYATAKAHNLAETPTTIQKIRVKMLGKVCTLERRLQFSKTVEDDGSIQESEDWKITVDKCS